MKEKRKRDSKFINFMIEKGLTDNTYYSYESDVSIFKKYYFDSYGEDLTELIHADILMYKTFLTNSGAKVTTINRKLAALKIYNLFLIQEKVQDNIVVLEKDYIKLQSTIIQKSLPTTQEINKIKHMCCKDKKNAKRDHCMVSIFIYSGVRASELVCIRVSDVHLDERYINIIGKGNKFRQVMINSYMYDAIKEYLEERLEKNINSPYLIVGQKTNNNDGKHMNRNLCNRTLEKYKDICKVAKLYPHLLRSYFCSNALHNAGYKIDQVANQAGHYSLNTTRKYLSSDREDLLDLADKL